MNYRLVRFQLGPDNFEAAKVVFDDLVPIIKAQDGCREVIAFGDIASGQYGFSVVWESAETSENAKMIIGPKLSKHLAESNATNNPFSSDLFEIFEN